MLKDYLGGIDLLVLIDRISKFRDLDFKRMSSEEIFKRFCEVMAFGPSDKPQMYMYPCRTRYFDVGTRFYRVRKLESTLIPLREMRTEADAWEAPQHVVRAGRLNRANESLLYTAPDMNVALEELKVSHGEVVPIIVYEAVEPIATAEIGIPAPDEGLSADERTKLRVLTDFLRHEFIREVGQGTEHLYKISEAIAKNYFDLPPDISDGWCYPSVARKGGINTCFRPVTAKKKLALQGFMLASAQLIDNNYSTRILTIAHGFHRDGQFVYHPLSSEVRKRIFREITWVSQ